MKSFRTVLGLLAAVLLVSALWFAGDVWLARLRTPALVRDILASSTLTVKDLSPWQLKALLAVEDPKFYTHHGIDLETPGAGLTTITQGIGKQLYFKPFKPGIRKLRLMALAKWVLDPLVSKDDQLSLFINLVYLGRDRDNAPVNGLAAAARSYYGKTVAELTEPEYLSIIAMIIAPVNFHILTHPEANRERTQRLQKVVSGEYKPKDLMDLYYGPLSEETQQGLAPASYFPSIYQQE